MALLAAYRVGIYRPTNKYPWDIIVKFLHLNIKAKVLECYWEQQSIIIEDKQVQLFPGVSGITLDKRRNLKFLTKELQSQGIQYKREIPFKHAAKTQIIRTKQEAKEVLKK